MGARKTTGEGEDELPVVATRELDEDDAPTDRRPAPRRAAAGAAETAARPGSTRGGSQRVAPEPAHRALSLPKPGEVRSARLEDLEPTPGASPPAPPRPTSQSLREPPAPRPRPEPARSGSSVTAGSGPRVSAGGPPTPRRESSRLGLLLVVTFGAALVGLFVYAAGRRPVVVEVDPRLVPATAADPAGSVPSGEVVAGGGVATPRRARAPRAPADPTGKREPRWAVDSPGRRSGSRSQLAFRDPATQDRFGFEVPERPKKRDYETEATPATPAMFMIMTQPPGVAVEIDGNLVGVTPFIRPAPADKDFFEVRLSGGAYEEQRLTVRRAEDGNYRLGAKMVVKPRDLPPPRPLPSGHTSTKPRAPDPVPRGQEVTE